LYLYRQCSCWCQSGLAESEEIARTPSAVSAWCTCDGDRLVVVKATTESALCTLGWHGVWRMAPCATKPISPMAMAMLVVVVVVVVGPATSHAPRASCGSGSPLSAPGSRKHWPMAAVCRLPSAGLPAGPVAAGCRVWYVVCRSTQYTAHRACCTAGVGVGC
jgi:hypothetical protein